MATQNYGNKNNEKRFLGDFLLFWDNLNKAQGLWLKCKKMAKFCKLMCVDYSTFVTTGYNSVCGSPRFFTNLHVGLTKLSGAFIELTTLDEPLKHSLKMKLFVKYDINKACKMLLREQLEKLGVAHTITAFGEVEIEEPLSGEKMKSIATALNHYGIEIVESQKNIIIQKIKDAIIEMVFNEDALPSSKISYYLSEKLGYSYGYISNLFSDATFSSIENFIILQKIERAKQLITTNEYTFTEIAWKLNYSSVAHFSTQFKNATGLTPSAFQRIINKRREAAAK